MKPLLPIYLFLFSVTVLADSRTDKLKLFMESNDAYFYCQSSQVTSLAAKELMFAPSEWKVTVFKENLAFNIYKGKDGNYTVILNEENTPSFFTKIKNEGLVFTGSSKHKFFSLLNEYYNQNIYFSAGYIHTDSTSKLKWLAHGNCSKLAEP